MQPGAHNVTNTSSFEALFSVLQLVSTYIHVYYHHVLIKLSLNLIIKVEFMSVVLGYFFILSV